MESCYDGESKDTIWDSDIEPAEAIYISSEADLPGWFLQRDVKCPAVILRDKLISDALLNGSFPINSEHSYCLNNEYDTMLEYPQSLCTKLEAMDDESCSSILCKTESNHICHTDGESVDPKCLCISISNSHLSKSPLPALDNPLHSTTLVGNNLESLSDTDYTDASAPSISQNADEKLKINRKQLQNNLYDLLNLSTTMNSITDFTFPKHGVMPEKQQITKQLKENDDYASDIEIDEACIKDEPISPNSDSPPNSCLDELRINGMFIEKNSLNMDMMNLGGLDKSDYVFESNNGCLKLSQSSPTLVKSQDLAMSSSSYASNMIVPKIQIKTECNSSGMSDSNSSPAESSFESASSVHFEGPLTPPSSLASDGSEEKPAPAHAHTTANGNVTAHPMLSPTSNVNNSTNVAHNTNGYMRGDRSVGINYNASRQPIRTPLISSQPKGSTGTLILTEEEKRTLVAEGYPIPQKLPLTKAEEKSLKKIRRKIKNKISAQESRRKKKEYMDQLERRVEVLMNENKVYKSRIEHFEKVNTNLLKQLQKLEVLVNKYHMKRADKSAKASVTTTPTYASSQLYPNFGEMV